MPDRDLMAREVAHLRQIFSKPSSACFRLTARHVARQRAVCALFADCRFMRRPFPNGDSVARILGVSDFTLSYSIVR